MSHVMAPAEAHILLHNDKCKIVFYERCSSHLIITFNSMGLTLDDEFGTNFFEDKGVSQINIACAPKDFFQHLSIESFTQTVVPIAEKYPDVVTYGTSLGGYAAIYFGSALNSRTLAIAPRFPPHDYMNGQRSYAPDIQIQHTDLRHIEEQKNSILTVFDPEDETDAEFVSYFLKGKPNTKFIELKKSGHYILKQLELIDKLRPCIENFIFSNDFQEKTIDINSFTLARRHKAKHALDNGDLKTARHEIQYLIKVRTGHDPLMTPWGLIKQYVELCDQVDLELPHILPTEFATLSRRMGKPDTPQKMMESIIKHNYLTCQYQACLNLSELTCKRFSDSGVAQSYLIKAANVLSKLPSPKKS